MYNKKGEIIMTKNVKELNAQELDKVAGGGIIKDAFDVVKDVIDMVKPGKKDSGGQSAPATQPTQPTQSTTQPASPTETRHTTITSSQGDKSKFLVIERDVHGPVTM